MGITVRRATEADAEWVSTLNAEVQALHAAALPWRFKPPGTFAEADVSALLAKPENLIFLALVDGDPAGYAYAEVVRRPETPLTYAYEQVHIHHLGVSSNYRRQAVGGALLGAVRAAALELGIALLTLDVWSFNEGARAFFRRHGFCSYIERLWCR
jgi:ribosomal protein S18 acetylase RimI-like enzyme